MIRCLRKQRRKYTGINRGTFYLHYVDKFEVMEQIQMELLEGFQETLKNHSKRCFSIHATKTALWTLYLTVPVS